MASASAPYFFMSYGREDVVMQWMEQILAGLQRMVTVITSPDGDSKYPRDNQAGKQLHFCKQ
jgi:hypothetical protein